MIRLPLTRDAIGPVARGHPWVYADGLRERAATGELVQLLDERGRVVGFGLADEGDIAVRVLGRHPVPLKKVLAERLAEAMALRRMVLPPQTDAFRLVNAAGDGLPGLVVDRYAGLLVLRLYSAAWEPHLDELVRALVAAVPGVSIARRLGVRRVDAGEGLVPLHGGDPPELLVVEEAGLRFLVRPAEGQKTGLFLDQREHRRFVGGIARGREVLNLFSYTGGFSVHAAAGGASRVVSVDVAEAALVDARENFRLNGFDPDRHGFECADVFQWEPKGMKPELLICDPPSLSHGQGSDRAASVAYRDLAERTGQMLGMGGLLATASCTARLSEERWQQAIRDGLRKAGRWSWLWRAAEPPDHPVSVEHPEGRYLKFGLLHRRG